MIPELDSFIECYVVIYTVRDATARNKTAPGLKKEIRLIIKILLL